MRILKKNFNGIAHIGLVLKLYEDVVLVSSNLNEKDIKDIDMKREFINSSIISPYILEFEDKIIISENSPEDMKRILNKYFDIIEIKTKKNLLGNIFLIGKNGIIYSRAPREDVEKIVNITGLPAYKIKGPGLIPTMIKVYNKKAMASQLLPDKILERIKEILGVNKFDVGSVNFGSPYLKYGIEINKNYLIVGEQTTGHELVKIEEFFKE